MEFRAVANGAWLEGLALDGQVVWYSDVLAGGVRRLSPNGKTDIWRNNDRWIGGLMLNADGKILSSGTGGITWHDPVTGASGSLVNSCGGRPLAGVNEMAADATGGIVFGTVDIPAFESGKTFGPSGLYRISRDGKVSQLCDGLAFSNGLAFSPDLRQLYHNESFVGTSVYQVDEAGGLSAPRRLIDKPDCDGLKVTVDGRIWITGFRSPEILILRPDGTVDGTVALPAEAATNLCFGGDDDRDLYVTTVTAVDVGDPSEIKAPHHSKSVLFRGRSPVAGQPTRRPRFTLG